MIEVKHLQQAGGDQRGATFVFDNDRTGQFILIYRVAGSVSGSEYHTGKHSYKSPERLIVVKGKGVLEWADMQGTAKGSCILEAPVDVRIPAMVWHRLTAETDLTVLELNALAHCGEDTIKVFEHPKAEDQEN